MREIVSSLVILALVLPAQVLAIMSSANYTIFADSIDSGGSYSASGTYSLQDSLGEAAPDITTSTGYTIRGGYQAMDWDYIGLVLSSSSLDLGQASILAVVSASTTATVTTEAISGYDLGITATSGTHLAYVGDGAVTVGVEEYGVAVAGQNATFGNDRAPDVGLNLASSTQAMWAVTTTLTFKAAISGATAFGAYTNNITLIAANRL